MQQQSSNEFIPDFQNFDVIAHLIIITFAISLMVEIVANYYRFNFVYFSVFLVISECTMISTAFCITSFRSQLNKLPISKASIVITLISILWVVFFMFIVKTTNAKNFPPYQTNYAYVRCVILVVISHYVMFRYFYLQHQKNQQIITMKAEHIELLQAKMQPHFLFNSFNSIISLIDFEPEKAQETIVDLSHLLRSSLKMKAIISWREEKDLVQRYLNIEKLRLDERLQWQFIDEFIDENTEILQWTLQPLIENAIVYGIAPSLEGGKIIICATLKDKIFELSITNPYNANFKKNGGNGFALGNLKERLKFQFGDTAKLEQFIEETTYTVVASWRTK